MSNVPSPENTQLDNYLTVEAPLRAPEFKVKGSRFITDIIPVTSKEEIEHALTSIRKEFYDASHHCFAYRLGPGGLMLRAADDGEPTGTAGKPILLVLTSAKLTNTLIVVTRYFGGTKLGTGGLARAYAEAAQQAVSLSAFKKVYLTDTFSLIIPYEELSQVERIITQFEGMVTKTVYLDSVQLEVAVRKSQCQQFWDAINETFYGKVAIHRAP